jgi:hypothetical protein
MIHNKLSQKDVVHGNLDVRKLVWDAITARRQQMCISQYRRRGEAYTS